MTPPSSKRIVRRHFVSAACRVVATAFFLASSVVVTFAADKPAESARPNFTPEQHAFFEKEVQPLLVAKCLKCHGAEAKVSSDFYMTSRAAVLKGGELGPAVDLAKPAESQLLQAVRYEGLQMPPSGRLSAEQVAVLTRWVNEGLPWPAHLEKEPSHAAEKPKIVVDDEARKYWAYQPVREPSVPSTKDRAWARTPIDAFVLAKLEAEGLVPSADADPRTLIRRATYDLTGLPPSPEEAEEFVRDFTQAQGEAKNKVYAALVERLLASPHYGEKWGRHWLDLVRFAETHGYERDGTKPEAWRYRDYVIQAFNTDKPYDQFVREQLAGDELPQPTRDSLTATGFYRLGIWDDEPADRDLALYDELDGIAATTGSVVLGTSIGCARCHDHKRDPISQRDYYRLLANFRDVVPMNKQNLHRFASEEDRKQFEARTAAKRDREATLFSQTYAFEQRFLAAAKQAGIELDLPQGSDLSDLKYREFRDTWTTLPNFDSLKPETQGPAANNRLSLGPASREEAVGLVFDGKLKVPEAGEYEFEMKIGGGARLTVDGKTVLNAPRPGRHVMTGRVKLKAGSTPFRFEFFNDLRKPDLNVAWSGPGVPKRTLSDRAAPGERVDDRTWAFTTKNPKPDWMRPAFDEASWERGPAGFGTMGTPGAEIGTVWNTKQIFLRRNFRLSKVPAKLALDVHHDEDVVIYLNGKKVYEQKGYLRDYERVELSGEATKALKPGDNVIAVSCKQTGGGQYIDVRFADQPQSLADLVRKEGPKLLGEEEVGRYVKQLTELDAVRSEKLEPPGTDLMSVSESGSKPTHILLRGLPAAKGDEVTAGVPEVLVPAGFSLAPPQPIGGSSGKRTALASWLTDAKNPLTARVMANRIWQYHFGRGLVASANDFGRLGELPSHPELLDWLAAEFIRNGWSVKSLHRTIMASSVYRQGSAELGARSAERGVRSAERGDRQEFAKDPANRLLWRFPARRLTAEEVRDSLLAASGKLDLRVGGPSVFPPIPKEVLAGQSRPGEGWPTSKSEDVNRRSVYVCVKRSLQLPILSAYDQADTDSSCAVRYVTTVPTQSLGTMNGEFMQVQAAALAERVQREAGDDPAARIRRAVQLTTLRDPTPEEIARDRGLIDRARNEGRLNEADAWKLYCLMCLNANEFYYLD